MWCLAGLFTSIQRLANAAASRRRLRLDKSLKRHLHGLLCTAQKLRKKRGLFIDFVLDGTLGSRNKNGATPGMNG
jgi:hypothetical protein